MDDVLSVREEALAGVEVAVDLLEDHFGFPVPVSRSPHNNTTTESGPAQFTFDTKVCHLSGCLGEYCSIGVCVLGLIHWL